MEKIQTANKKLPIYLKEIYGWIYENKSLSNFFDKFWVQRILSCGYNQKLADSLVGEIRPGSRVMQFGATFGPQIEATADKIGFNGIYDIMDVSKVQTHRVKNKYQYIFRNINPINHDASKKLIGDGYDVVICYMILHEVPPQTKAKIVENALKSIHDNGKVIFVDYHRPKKHHPLKFITKSFNRLYQPFAEKLWEREISSYATDNTKYSWKKATYFKRMYQKVVVTRKHPIY